MKIKSNFRKLLSFISHFSFQKGFTLIELLIVIAIMGVLAAIVLVSLDPINQLARGRDAGRKTAVGQMGAAVNAYFTSRIGTYPTANATWITSLVTAGEVKVVPTAIAYSANGVVACTTNVQSSLCYLTNVTPDAAVWLRLESKSEIAKCAVGTNPYFMWDSSRGSTCLVCTAAEPTIGAACNATQ